MLIRCESPYLRKGWPLLRIPPRVVRIHVISRVQRLELQLRSTGDRQEPALEVEGPAQDQPDVGPWGGGAGKHMVYLSGVTDHHVNDADMVEHIVRLVEAKAAEMENHATRPEFIEAFQKMARLATRADAEASTDHEQITIRTPLPPALQGELAWDATQWRDWYADKSRGDTMIAPCIPEPMCISTGAVPQ